MLNLTTQMNGFDILVAITQKTINTQFAGLKRLRVIADDLAITLPRRLGTLNAKVLAPTVVIDTGETQRVLFILNLASGSYSTYDDNNNPVDISFGQSSIGFRVDINLADIDSTKVPQSVIDSIKNLGPGMFSMRQLFMDLQNANLAEYDPKHTSLPTSLTGDPLFIAGLSMYFKQLHDQGANVLGYAVRVTNPYELHPEAPSFPPTDLNFAAHVYAEPVTNARNPDLDTLNYLLMTEHHNFPANVLPSGNFVDMAGVDGTMAIAKSVFIDQFLLSKLVAITNLTSTFSQRSERGVTISTHTGGQFAETAGGWSFSSANDITLASSEGAGGTFPSDLYWKLEHSCNLTIAPGSNVLKLIGKSTYYNSVECWAGVKYHAMSEQVWFSSTIDWDVTITLAAVQDGANIAATVVTTIGDPQPDEGGNWLGKLENVINKDAIVQQMHNISDTLSSLISRADIGNQLNRAFAKQNAFVFPGGQEYFFKDLFFNNEHDLLATVTIKFY